MFTLFNLSGMFVAGLLQTLGVTVIFLLASVCHRLKKQNRKLRIDLEHCQAAATRADGRIATLSSDNRVLRRRVSSLERSIHRLKARFGQSTGRRSSPAVITIPLQLGLSHSASYLYRSLWG